MQHCGNSTSCFINRLSSGPCRDGKLNKTGTQLHYQLLSQGPAAARGKHISPLPSAKPCNPGASAVFFRSCSGPGQTRYCPAARSLTAEGQVPFSEQLFADVPPCSKAIPRDAQDPPVPARVLNCCPSTAWRNKSRDPSLLCVLRCVKIAADGGKLQLSVTCSAPGLSPQQTQTLLPSCWPLLPWPACCPMAPLGWGAAPGPGLGVAAATGKALELALVTKQASHPKPESGKGRKERRSFGWPMSSFPNQLLVAQVVEGSGTPLPRWGTTAGRSTRPTGEVEEAGDLGRAGSRRQERAGAVVLQHTEASGKAQQGTTRTGCCSQMRKQEPDKSPLHAGHL